MFVSAGEQGWGKGPGKLPSPSLWVPGEGESSPLLNLASAARSSGGGPPGWGLAWGGRRWRRTLEHRDRPLLDPHARSGHHHPQQSTTALLNHSPSPAGGLG